MGAVKSNNTSSASVHPKAFTIDNLNAKFETPNNYVQRKSEFAAYSSQDFENKKQKYKRLISNFG